MLFGGGLLILLRVLNRFVQSMPQALAAEAKKAESASVAVERIPRPPSFTERDAWSQFSSDSSTFKMLIKAPCVAATLDSSGVEIIVFFRS